MSWGVFVSFSLALTEAQWKTLSRQTPAAAGEGTSWEAWPDAESVWYFTAKQESTKPLAKLLTEAAWEDEEFEDVGLSIAREGGQVRFELFAFLDRSAHQIHEVGVLARALVGGSRLGGTGSLVISSDGSAPAGVGWRCVATDGVLTTTPLTREETDTLREAASERLGIEEE